MASALINNASQIYFDSVLGMEEEGMVKMFKALESSGLREFLGCTSAIYEAALVEFFQNASVRDGKVVGTIQGNAVEFTEEVFAGTFELPTEGLTDMIDVPKELVFDAKFSYDVIVKAGSFDSVTHERFLMMSDIHDGVKGAPDLELEELKEFPSLKILTAKTVGTYVAKNKNITVDADEPAGDEPVVKKKAASKKRPAPTVGEPVAKKKKTTVEKAAPSDKDLALVSVAQDVEPISTVPAVTPRAPRHRAPRRKLILPTGSDGEKEPDVGDAVEKERETTVVDDVDKFIVQVITETSQMETYFVEPGITRSAEIELEHSIAFNDEDDNLDGAENEISRNMASITAPKQFLKEHLRSEKNKETDIAPVETEKEMEQETALMDVQEHILEKDTEPLSKALELTEIPSTSDEELMSLQDLFKQIPDDMMMPSVTAAEPTKIKFGQGIEIREVVLYKASLPHIAEDDKGKEPLLIDTIQGHPAREIFSLSCADIDFLVQLIEQVIEEVVKFFSSFSLRRLAVLDSVKDIAAKEELVLTWAETDSVHIALQRWVYIISKYREMLLQKFLEARRHNFVSGTPTTTIDLKFLDLLTTAHHFALKILLRR
ncbi:splicing factor 3B subunit 1-like [Dorcoceras hygrometricum]|uniref:Splicing factor 3B subunit 1-like n=1 Tax=Dorcoceras hygrometricum TaxID=472368 RepID=A0A2Z7ASL7_9LAMI|nr:splicing factor 3B subunit 1-like [Dorcoceras hygrometricum]